jgi:hypothetical protein
VMGVSTALAVECGCMLYAAWFCMAAVVLCCMLRVFAWLPSCCVVCCMCLHGCMLCCMLHVFAWLPSCCVAAHCRANAALMLHYCWAVVRWAWLVYVPYCSMGHRRAAHHRSRPHLSRRKCRGTHRCPHSSRSKDCTPCPSSAVLGQPCESVHCCPRTAAALRCIGQ